MAVRFRLNIEVRKEKEDSWLNDLNAITTKNAFVNDQMTGNALKLELSEYANQIR